MKTSEPPSLFGAAAVRLGYVSQDQVEKALAAQADARSHNARPGPIGALLMERGLLSPGQITSVLRHLAGGTLPLSEDGIRLAARLKVLHAGAGNVIGITGTLAEDASRTTCEVAVGLAVMEQGEVLSIDANLRSPSLHHSLGTPLSPGLLERIVLGKQAPPPVSTKVAALNVVAAGEAGEDFLSLCMSPQAAQLIESYRASYRYVLVNLGDLIRHPEAAVLASRCDGVVVVLRAGLSQKSELRDLQSLLTGLDVGLSGVVLAREATRKELRRAG
jgi:Mrp family chromosome partitioning ATPase